MIPVDTAVISDAYQCPWTSTLFTDKKLYAIQLANYRESHIREKIRARNWEKDLALFNAQPDFDSMVQWIENNPIRFISNGLRHRRWKPDRHIKIPSDFKIKILKFKLEYSDKVRNSHSCPRDGVRNWSNNIPGVPDSYPGWRGSFNYWVSHEIYGVGSDMFMGTGINTGTGGSGRACYWGYEVSLFASDWPVMNSKLSSDRCEALLKNDRFVSKWSYES